MSEEPIELTVGTELVKDDCGNYGVVAVNRLTKTQAVLSNLERLRLPFFDGNTATRGKLDLVRYFIKTDQLETKVRRQRLIQDIARPSINGEIYGFSLEKLERIVEAINS